ncbi:MAG: sulfatase [Phycisphaerae bacterium]|nr:sulfatase [Phycisphaerae bacterium]
MTTDRRSSNRDCDRRRLLRRTTAIAALLLTVLAAHAVAAPPTKRPNIIFFLVDDMGWMDSTVYGSRYYETPNMERLAARGMMFTDAYAANPLCSPTRASILTGKYPARLRITTPSCHLPPLGDKPLLADSAPPHQEWILPLSRRFLPPSEYTIAEALRDAGYKTAHIGKWHLGLRPEHWPITQGFDVCFQGAPDPGPPSYFSPYGFKAGSVTDGPKGEYITDRVTDEALKFIESNRNGPFLLHLWHYAVHGPWGHKEEITKRFMDKKDPRGKQGNPIMASMIKSVDESLGRVLDKLDELKIADNTLIILFSDNGGNVHSNTPDDAKGKRAPKGSRRGQMIESWRRFAGDRPPTNNAPLRGGKATIFEGGSREPMLVCWPGVVKPASKCPEIVSSVDFYPTILEILGLAPKPGQILDGESIVPLLRQTGKLKREAIFCHFPHGFGGRSPAATYVRKGNWKLIRVYVTSSAFPDKYMLFNLKDDLGETTNLAAKMPDKVKELDALIDKFLADTDALIPKRNPAYRAWAPGKDTTVAEADGVLKVESPKRAVIQTRETPKVAGPLTVKLRMRSNKGRDARLYWATEKNRNFTPDRFVGFNVTRDGQWHELAVDFTAEADLIGLRIDPSMGPGNAEIDWIRLVTPDGRLLKGWESP